MSECSKCRWCVRIPGTEQAKCTLHPPVVVPVMVPMQDGKPGLAAWSEYPIIPLPGLGCSHKDESKIEVIPRLELVPKNGSR